MAVDRETEIKQLGKITRLLLERPLHLIPDVHPDEQLEDLIAKQSKEVKPQSGLVGKKKSTLENRPAKREWWDGRLKGNDPNSESK